MKKSILEVYALAVCFVTLVCFVVTLGVVIYDIIQIANPEFTLNSYEYNRYQTNDTFWASLNKCDNKGRPPEVELTKQRIEGYEQAIRSEKRNAFHSITISFIIIVIDIIVFLIHWQISRRARETNIAT